MIDVTCARCGLPVEHRCLSDDAVEAEAALYAFRPDNLSDELKEALIAGGGDPEDFTAPFLSEAMLYPLLGKDDARTLLCRLNNLLGACGVEPTICMADPKRQAELLMEHAQRLNEDAQRLLKGPSFRELRRAQEMAAMDALKFGKTKEPD